MSDVVDLAKLVNTYNGKLQNVILYGQIVETMQRPLNLGMNVELDPSGNFYKMDVFAVNLSYYNNYLKQNGLLNKDCIFMTNGSIIVYADTHCKPLPQFYELACSIASSKSDKNYLCAFKWCKNGNKWGITASALSDIDISLWDKDSRYKLYISKSYESGCLIRPKDVMSVDEFYSAPRGSFTFKPTPQPSSLADATKIYENNVKISTSVVQPFVVHSREKIEPKSKYIDGFGDKIKDSKIAKKTLIQNIINEFPLTTDVSPYILETVNAISANFKNKPNFNSMTGKSIITKYLKSFGNIYDKKYMGTTVGKFLISNWNECKDYLLYGKTILASDKAFELCKSAFGNAEYFYASIVANICGINQESLSNLADFCSQRYISFSEILNTNPYLLHLLGLSYNDTEHLVTCFGFQGDRTLDKYRNIASLNNFCRNSDNGSTVYELKKIAQYDIGVSLTKAKYEKVVKTGTFLTPTTMSNIHYYLKNNKNVGMLPTTGYTKSGYKWIIKIPQSELTKATDDYVESGLGCKILDNKYLVSSHYLERELFIYNSLYRMGEHSYSYDHAKIDQLIDEYETEVAHFKLEEAQRRAVHLCDFQGAVVTGGAGSGKTTTANCLVYVLEHLEPNLEIKYAAPTGKAAKRLQEVIKRPVKTMHSMFKIGTSDEKPALYDDESCDGTSFCAYIFDENAMVTSDLLYSVLTRTNERSRIYFLGDINQLPPIGKGVPFKDMLRFMPCVELTVSKRAAEGSDITKNSDILNHHSSTFDFQPITSGKDFFTYECNEANMLKVIYELCRYYLGKSNDNNTQLLCKLFGVQEMPKVDDLTPDDIQVVSPFDKDTYSWGANKLNQLLQPLFNPSRGHDETFIFNKYSKFQIGDRVIHKNKNNYNMQWYSSYQDGEFQKIYGAGICNGDVGKIVAVYPAETCEFLKEIEEKPDPDEFEYPDNLRDDSSWSGYFVVVEYFDYMSDRKFYILYRCELGLEENPNGIDLNGDDLSLLNLFYAGTTHKLQGSQAKIIITGLQPVNYSGFITRNMLYTMWTRGICLVFVLGDVGNGQNSMLTRARKDIAGSDTVTLGSLL